MHPQGILDGPGRRLLSQLIFVLFTPALTFNVLAPVINGPNLLRWLPLPLNVALRWVAVRWRLCETGCLQPAAGINLLQGLPIPECWHSPGRSQLSPQVAHTLSNFHSIAVGLSLGLLLRPLAPAWFRPHTVAATGLGNVGNLPLVLVAALVHEAGDALGEVSCCLVLPCLCVEPVTPGWATSAICRWCWWRQSCTKLVTLWAR